MPRIRRDVWSLTKDEGDWPEALVAYERAVDLLRKRDPGPGPPQDPRGWRFLAAIHGLADANGNADTSDPLWCNCQHGSWFFFPWHRMYLLAFELIIQDVLGDPDWSLPYWYAVDPDDPDSSILPPAFRDESRSLHTTERSHLSNGGNRLPDLSASLIQALSADVFSTDAGTSTFGGGARSDPSFDGDEIGLLEGTPHGGIHMLVGADFTPRFDRILRMGWMASPFEAALDPIFWLHHANIDRLWEVWRKHDPRHQNPPPDAAGWLDTKFEFPGADGEPKEWTIGQVLETTDLGYEYDNTDAPSGLPPAPAPEEPDMGLEEVVVPEPPQPQVVGATQNVPLGTSEPVEVELSQPVETGLAAGDEGDQPTGGRVYLRLEGVTGTTGAPVYDIYINVPPGESPEEHPELRAGSLPTFRMREASRRDDVHDGSGITAVFDVTAVRDVLAKQERWDPDRLQVTFRPITGDAPVDTPGIAEEVDAPPPDVQAGQVVVMVD